MTQIMSEFKTLEFFEFPFKNHLKDPLFKLDVTSFGTEFSPSLISNGKFDNDAYCFCLMKKLYDIDKEDLLVFFQYQIAQLKQPIYWIKTLDNLIDVNKEILTNVFCEVKLEKCKAIIETLREIQFSIFSGEEHEATKFSISNLKEKLAKCESYQQQEQVIIDAETDFQQNAQRNLIDYSCFQSQIDLEKKRLDKKKVLNAPLAHSKDEKSEGLKLQINGSINQLVDAFYHISYELSLVDFEQHKLAKHICNNFLDKNGNELSFRTVETILDPNKPEKRPPEHKRYFNLV